MRMIDAYRIHQQLDKDLTELSEAACARRSPEKRLVGCIHAVDSFGQAAKPTPDEVRRFRAAAARRR